MSRPRTPAQQWAAIPAAPDAALRYEASDHQHFALCGHHKGRDCDCYVRDRQASVVLAVVLDRILDDALPFDEVLLGIYGAVPTNVAQRNGAVAYLSGPYGQEQLHRARVERRGRFWMAAVGDAPPEEWADEIGDVDAVWWILAHRSAGALQ